MIHIRLPLDLRLVISTSRTRHNYPKHIVFFDVSHLTNRRGWVQRIDETLEMCSKWMQLFSVKFVVKQLYVVSKNHLVIFMFHPNGEIFVFENHTDFQGGDAALIFSMYLISPAFAVDISNPLSICRS